MDINKVNLIWKTPNYPDYNWTVRSSVEKDYGTGFIQKIKLALLKLSDKELLALFARNKFIEAKNEDYQPILENAQAIGILQ